MSHFFTPADRIGAGLTLCGAHEKVVAASVAVLAAHEDRAPSDELQALRRVRDGHKENLNRLYAQIGHAFTPKSHEAKGTAESRYHANG